MTLRAACAALAAGAAGGAGAQSLDAERLAAWLADYEAAWEQRDAGAAARLFTDDARYYETPFSEPFSGPNEIAEYWATVTAEQRDIDFQYDVVAVEGDTGVARWYADFSVGPEAEPVVLDGVFVLTFDGERVAELREWWHMGP